MKSKRHYSKIELIIRSFIFSTCSIVSMFLYSFLCLFSLIFPVSVRYYFIRFYLRFYIGLLKHVCHIDYQVTGLENIPKDRSVVVFSKHSSAWETFYLPIIFHDPAVIAKRELVWLPFFGWGLASSDPILINRSDKTSAMQQIINKGQKCLDKGRDIIIFPEGTRIPFGKVGKYHLGGARLACATHAPVLPIAHNAGYFWPKKGFIKKPGTLSVAIGPLMETEGQKPEDVMSAAKDWIETTISGFGGLVDEPASE